MSAPSHALLTTPVPGTRPAVWCAGVHPVCPACGGRLYVAVDRNQTMRGACRNRVAGKQCPQHFVAVGIGGDVTVVLALSPTEFHDLGAGRKLVGVRTEGVTWAPRG